MELDKKKKIGKFNWRIAAFILLVLSIGLSAYIFAQHRDLNTEAMLDASVSIRTISHVRIDEFGDSVWSGGSGSGFLVSTQPCEVWTNHHVVENAAVVEVRPRGWTAARGINATIVDATPRTDLAILHLEHCDGMTPAQLGDSASVRPGNETYAVGNPLGMNPDSVSRGIISHTERYAGGPTPYLQTDAAINRGNSGGALFNRDGKVIGMNTAIAAPNGSGNVGIGYATPINLVVRAAAKLHQGSPSWGDAGIKELMSSLTPDEAEIFRVPHGHGAVSLAKAPEDGPSAGKLFARDVIFKINDDSVTSVAQAKRLVSGHNAGETVAFHLVRNGAVETVDVTLVEGWKPEEPPAADEYTGHLGLSLEMWPEDDERGTFNAPVITHVKSLGPAHRGYITSSQRSVTVRGPYLMPYQLDVKTVTGVVVHGEYHSVADVQDVGDFAELAYRDKVPLLLEIETWGRSNPKSVQTPLEHLNTTFYKVVPAPSASPVHDPEIRMAEQPGDETLTDAGTPAEQLALNTPKSSRVER